MTFSKTDIEGLTLIEPNILGDERGRFIKTLHKETFEKHGLATNFEESFFSTSSKDVLRGMHFQTPPHDHEKLVYVPNGAILDVVVDLRKDSLTYGKYVSKELNAKNGHIFYIPRGCAHGFLSLEDNTMVTYMQTSMYAPNNDTGIAYDSFGFDWGITNPLVSDRDKTFPTLDAFNTPFN